MNGTNLAWANFFFFSSPLRSTTRLRVPRVEMDTVHSKRGTKRQHSGEEATRTVSTNDDGDAPLPRRRPTQRARLDDDGDQIPGRQTTTHYGTPGDRNETYFRNLYASEPNFAHLGQKYPDFGALFTDGSYLDFTDPAAVMQLTKTLLLESFGLRVSLPADRLCPPVPNRHNYILWLKDLLDSTSASYTETYETERKVTGLDIGTGASLIYPLLGCAQRPGWSFVATDIDAESLVSARANAHANGLDSRIRVVDRAGGASNALIPLDELEDLDTLDFVMTNPPFYASDDELLDLAARKAQPPHSACTGAAVEMVCEGGEVAFVGRMVEESLVLRDRVQWYTAMLGKQSSLETLIERLRGHGITNFAATTFIQGSRTRRWALGWSFLTRRPSLRASRGCSSSLVTKKMLPAITAVTIYESPSNGSVDPILEVTKILCDTVEALDLRSWAWDKQRLRGVGFADGNVWSRAYRRRKKVSESASTKKEVVSATLPDIAKCVFGFSLSVQGGESDQSSSGRLAIILRWLQGEDEALFESFAGVVRRCLRTDAARPS